MNRHMELLFDSLKEGLFMVAATGRILYANPAARAALPIVIGEPLPGEWLQNQITAIRKEYLKPPLRFEIDLLRDSAHPDRMQITLLPSPAGSDFIVLMQNITAEHLYENAIGNLAEMLDSEFRAPMKQFLAAVAEMLSLFEKHAGDNWLLQNTAAKVSRKGDSLSELLHKVSLLASTCKSSPMRGEERIGLSSLVDDALLAVGKPLAERGIQIRFCGIDNDLPVIYGSRSFLAQALAGYLRDLIKQSNRGENILISASVKGSGVLLSIVNHEQVIPERSRPVQLPLPRAADSKLIEARGLTLSLCKRVVELHGGILHIDRQQGKARSVTFELPAGAPVAGSQEPALEQAFRYAQDLSRLLKRRGKRPLADTSFQRSTTP